MAAVETRNRLRKQRVPPLSEVSAPRDPFSKMPRFFGRSTAPRARPVAAAAAAAAAAYAGLASRSSSHSYSHDIVAADAESDAGMSASASAYEALLHSNSRSTTADDGDIDVTRRDYAYRHGPSQSQSQHNLQRAWLAAADARRPSWSGERPPARKLVKEPSGAARPTFSVEITDGNNRKSRSGGGGGGGGGGTMAASAGLRRKMARWKDAAWGERAVFAGMR